MHLATFNFMIPNYAMPPMLVILWPHKYNRYRKRKHRDKGIPINEESYGKS